MSRLFIAVPAIVLTMTMVALAQKPLDATPKKPAEDKAAAEKAALDPKQIAADINKAVEELLANALHNSPEVQVAEARLKEAEATLRQARLQVAQKTMEARQTLDARQHDAARAEALLSRAKKLREAGQIPATEFEAIEADLAKQKAAIAQIEGQLNMLTGKLPVVLEHSANRPESPITLFTRLDRSQNNLDLGGGNGVGDSSPKRQPQQEMGARLQRLVRMPFKVPDAAGGIGLSDLIAQIRDTAGAPILTKGINDYKVQIDFRGEVTLGAYFQMLCDSVPNLAIYVRDYGFLVTTEPPPDDALSFMDFWRGEKSGK